MIELQNKPVMGNKTRPWTAEDDRRLLELRAAGRSTISVAAALKRTKSAITHRIQDLRRRSLDNREATPEMSVQNVDGFNTPPAEIRPAPPGFGSASR
jgi:hypothetical protein